MNGNQVLVFLEANLNSFLDFIFVAIDWREFWYINEWETRWVFHPCNLRETALYCQRMTPSFWQWFFSFLMMTNIFSVLTAVLLILLYLVSLELLLVLARNNSRGLHPQANHSILTRFNSIVLWEYSMPFFESIRKYSYCYICPYELSLLYQRQVEEALNLVY